MVVTTQKITSILRKAGYSATKPTTKRIGNVILNTLTEGYQVSKLTINKQPIISIECAHYGDRVDTVTQEIKALLATHGIVAYERVKGSCLLRIDL